MKELEIESLEVFSGMFKAYGMKDLPLKVIATLYLEPGEITMEQISKRTGYSLASVSNALKLLDNIGTIQKRKKPGSKKVYFYMEKDLVRLNIQKLAATQEFFKPLRNSISNLIDKYKNKVKEPEDKKRLKIMEDYYSQLGSFETIIGKWKKDLENIAKK